jgi:acyl transferase domain-containing protein
VANAGYEKLVDFCLDAATRRVHQQGFRIAAVGRTSAELAASIAEQLDSEGMEPVSNAAQAPEVVFMFTGQGSHYAGMGAQLYRLNAVFRANMDECDALAAGHLDGASILKLVVLEADDKAPALARTLYTQPALFALEYSLARVWALMGVEPSVVVGHSVGEVVAAVEAGCLSLADGMKLICERAKAMDALPRGRGGMTVVFDKLQVVEGLASACSPPLEVAVINGETCINVAGDLRVREESYLLTQAPAFCRPRGEPNLTLVVCNCVRPQSLEQLEATLKTMAVRFKRLDVSHAFHTSAMDSALPGLKKAIKDLAFMAPKK